MTLSSRLTDIVGEGNVSTEPGDLAHWGLDWTRFYEPAPSAIVFPRSTEQVVQLVRLANAEQIALVPSGGRTGLSGGACALNGEVVVSFDRMNRILSFSEADAAVTLEAGVVTAALHNFAEEKGLFYPVDFASSGSSQIGGNIATNAGGIRVLRYGMTRNWVSGLKVVTGTGEVLDLNRGLLKNNTGYDLRHLFIGSEGTLGFVVEATLQLTAAPVNSTVMLLAVPRMEDCLSILQAFRSEVTLNAFEFFSEAALQHVLGASDLTAPFAGPSPYYVLLEYELGEVTGVEQAARAFEQCSYRGWVTDGIVSTSERQNGELWQYRERISESITPRTPYKNDISVQPGRVPEFLRRIDEVVAAEYPDFEIVWFGHIGDGNLHLNILKPDAWNIDRFKAECELVSEKVLAEVAAYGGSVSAEHGIGLLKKNQLHFSRSPEELASLRAIKRIFDPAGIMNPGKLIPAD